MTAEWVLHILQTISERIKGYSDHEIDHNAALSCEP